MLIIKLVGGFNPSEKYELVSWDDYSIPNCFWKVIKTMFETTNQIPSIKLTVRPCHESGLED